MKGNAKSAANAVQDATNAAADAGAPAVSDTAANTTAVTETVNPPAAGAEAPPAGVRDLIAQLPDGDQKAAILAALDADAAEVQKAAAPLLNPLAVALKAPDNISSVSIQGREYQVNEHGLIEIAIEDAHHIAIALEHGFQRAAKAVRNFL